MNYTQLNDSPSKLSYAKPSHDLSISFRDTSNLGSGACGFTDSAHYLGFGCCNLFLF